MSVNTENGCEKNKPEVRYDKKGKPITEPKKQDSCKESALPANPREDFFKVKTENNTGKKDNKGTVESSEGDATKPEPINQNFGRNRYAGKENSTPTPVKNPTTEKETPVKPGSRKPIL